MDSMIDDYSTLAIEYWYILVPSIVILGVIINFTCSKSNNKKVKKDKDNKLNNKQQQEQIPNKKNTSSSSSSNNNNSKSSTSTSTSSKSITKKVIVNDHQLFNKTFKSNSSSHEILGITLSPDSKYLAFCTAEERALKVINYQSCFEKVPKAITVPLPFDTASHVAWSADGQLFAILSDSKKIIGFKQSIVDDRTVFTKIFESDSGIAATCNITTLLAASRYLLISTDDTMVRLFNTDKGALLTPINTGQMKNYMASMSGNGKYFAIASFNSEIKVWEVLLKKDGSYEKCTKVMSLTGYKTSIFGLSFNYDGTRVVSVSKDGLIKLWSLDVKYGIGQDPECLYSIAADLSPAPSLISMSPDASLFAIGNASIVQFRRTSDGAIIDTLPHPSDGTPYTDNTVSWSPDSKYFFTCGSGFLTIWNSPSIKKTN